MTLRLPEALRDRLTKEAKLNGRSMNGEIVHRLEKTLEDDGSIYELWQMVEALERQVGDHEERLKELGSGSGFYR